MRILLTGASGFIGQHLLKALLADGHQVVCAVRTPKTSHDPRLNYVQADFANDTGKSVWLARLTSAEGSIDAVINTVGIFRESGSQTFERLHLETPRALFAACADSPQVQTIIQLSALGADDEAETRYHLSKKAGDDFLASLPLHAGQRAWIVQPSLVYGKEGTSARVFKMLASLPFAVRFGNAPQLVQPVHIDDVVGAILALLRQPSVPGGRAQRVPLVGPQALPFTDYLAALRSAMGMGRLRVLPLPGALARLMAKGGRWLPGALLDEDALRMLDRGNAGDPAAITALLGRPPKGIAEFIAEPQAERTLAKLGWLLPLLRWSIVAVWIATAIVSFGLYPVEASYDLLARTGIPASLQPLMLYGAAGFDLLLGLGIAFLPRRRPLWLAQLVLIGFYTVVIAFKLPEFLLHPYGPLTKNLPMLAAIWLLYELEEQ
ncbi:SDR family oxidoreductase [Massilia sp. Dwa41.01b]|uniref:SDR family oxidoreductase n=1 Tax=Massilia sp. Dwa41.01b TaxID=2709302 RepID=UPI001600A01E|nr:SDR family oxidoreductase [Massilia sp. Dwa41.01b]QNA87298.1 SDR family oxidoreductase [Massilia sp. Dwa41.01b]